MDLRGQPSLPIGDEPTGTGVLPGKRLNYGEWGELYVLLRLLGDGRLSLTDDTERLSDGPHMNVIEVIRRERVGRVVTYRRVEALAPDARARVHVTVGERETAVLPIEAFSHKADELLGFVLERRRAPFAVPDSLAEFLASIEVSSYKAASSDKSDIFLTVSDPRSGTVRTDIGYSIKTRWGKVSTLFNTARASAVVYRLSGMTSELADEVNGVVDQKGHVSVSDRCAFLALRGVCCEFAGFEIARRAGCRAFEENLDLLDPRLPRAIEAILRARFFDGLHQGRASVADLGTWLASVNPCGVTRPEVKYPYMLKQFLYAAYCGLTASTLWDGASAVNGGLLTVGEDGSLVAFNALDGDIFKSYLYRHCFFDYPDTSPRHGDYGYVYQHDGDWFFKLNFQVRYK